MEQLDNTTLVALVGIAASLIGSLIGGLITHLSARSIRHRDWLYSLQEKSLAKREAAYVDFLNEANKGSLLPIAGAPQSEILKLVAHLLAAEARCKLLSDDVALVAREIVKWMAEAAKTDRPEGSVRPFTELTAEFIAAARRDLDRVEQSANASYLRKW